MPCSVSSPPPSRSNYILLSSETLAAPAANFTSVTIPAGYTRLECFMFYKLTAGADDAKLTFNGDGGNNYSYETIAGSAGAASAGASAGVAYIRVGTSLAAIWQFTRIVIFQNGTTTKGVIANYGSSTLTMQTVGFWNNTNEITSLLITANASTLVAGSVLQVFGMV